MFGGVASRAFWGDEVPGAHEVPSPPPTPSHPHSCFYRGNCTLTTSQPLGSDRAASPVSAAPPAGPGAHPRDPQGSRPGSGAGSHSEVPAEVAPADLSSSSPFSLPGGREQTEACRRPAGLQAVPWCQAGLQDLVGGGPAPLSHLLSPSPPPWASSPHQPLQLHLIGWIKAKPLLS